MFLVTSAAGRTGRQVLSAMAARQQRVRAFIRDPKKHDIAIKAGAADVFVGSLEDSDSIARAIEGCTGIIHIGPPMHPKEVEITDGLIAAARRVGAQKFVYYSVMHPLRREVRHHRFKLDAEEHVIESGLPYTIIQPIRYMQHLEGIWSRVTQDGVHAMPFNVDVKFNVVDLFDLAEATAIVSASSGHDYATYELAGPEALSQTDMATVISSLIGKPVRAEQVLIPDMESSARESGVAEDRVAQMRIMNEHYDRYGFLGNSNVLKWILGRPPTMFRTYVERLVASQK